MKKVIVELFFLDNHNAKYISTEAPRLVYWHCSTLPPYKFERLIAKVGVGFSRLFAAALSHVICRSCSKPINVFTKTPDGSPQLWHCEVFQDSFRKTLQSIQKGDIKSLKNFSIEEGPFKIEVKIIKYRVMFGLYYSEDVPSTIICKKTLNDLDKFFRNIFKSLDI